MFRFRLSTIPRYLAKLGLSGAACIVLTAIALSVFTAPTLQAPAASARSAAGCGIQVSGNVPHTMPLAASEGCTGFRLHVIDQKYPTKITVCGQKETPPLMMYNDDPYDKTHCSSWVAPVEDDDSNTWHNFLPAHHPRYGGYVISFESTGENTGYAIRVEIQEYED